MTPSRRHLTTATFIAFGGLIAVAAHLQAQNQTPNDWLAKMARAVQTTNYEGTVIRIKNGDPEALKVVRDVTDGVIREKIVVQGGNGLELIRNGNEVHCVLPDQKSVLVDEWDEEQSLFSTLPSSNVRFGAEYDVLFNGKERVAGRKAIQLSVKPHDSFRFGHRIWLDIETGFPLKAMVIDADGQPIEQVQFAAIELDKEIQASALASSYSTDTFRWITESRRKVSRAVESDWASDDLPPGFRVVATHEEALPGSDESVTHLFLSDGLANVSVFIEPAAGKKIVERTQVGASNSYSVASGDYVITAVGDVPAATVEQIAGSVRPK